MVKYKQSLESVLASRACKSPKGEDDIALNSNDISLLTETLSEIAQEVVFSLLLSNNELERVKNFYSFTEVLTEWANTNSKHQLATL